MLNLNDLSERQQRILELLADQQWHTANSMITALSSMYSAASIKRDFRSLLQSGIVEQFGKARATKYRRSSAFQLLGPIDIEKYFIRPQDERGKNIRFNHEIFSQLKTLQIYSAAEKKKFTELLKKYRKNIENLNPMLLKREFERVTIDLSWKSSAIEGNTYTLLETETLLKEGIQASGKTPEEAAMLINHKTALEFIHKNSAEFREVSLSKIENVHSILSKDLGIAKNIRKRVVGITGTNYRPLDNEFQIREALENTCQAINKLNDVFAKALLAILLISYIQPFEDGNKRTARLMGNAILMAENAFPLSFRSVDATYYKKAMLLFYELNNLSEFKKLLWVQSQFAVDEYFQ